MKGKVVQDIVSKTGHVTSYSDLSGMGSRGGSKSSINPNTGAKAERKRCKTTRTAGREAMGLSFENTAKIEYVF